MSIVLLCFFRLRVLVFENHVYYHFVFFESRNSLYSYFRRRASNRENKNPAKKKRFTVLQLFTLLVFDMKFIIRMRPQVFNKITFDLTSIDIQS